MYDYYLDPNACLYGLHSGSEPLHIMYNPGDGMVMVANNTFKTVSNMMMVVKAYDMAGKSTVLTQVISDVTATTTKRYFSIKDDLDKLAKDKGVFVELELLDKDQKSISQNIYWVPDVKGLYSGLQDMPPSQLVTAAAQVSRGKIKVDLVNPANAPVAFFNRLSLINAQSGQRLLPAFYSDNYVSVLPGEHKTIFIDYDTAQYPGLPLLSISGWNLAEQKLEIKSGR